MGEQTAYEIICGPQAIQAPSMEPIVAIPQVGRLHHATNESPPKQDTILHANPSFAYSAFVVEHSQRTGFARNLNTLGYWKNCDIAKRSRIEFLAGTGPTLIAATLGPFGKGLDLFGNCPPCQ